MIWYGENKERNAKKMRVVQINSVCGIGSTGRIVADLCRTLYEEGHECLVGYGRGLAPQDITSLRMGSCMSVYFHAFMTRVTDKTGHYSVYATKNLINKLINYQPDVIHIHNLHGYYINIELLFKYINEAKIPVVWTLHDCWAFTGHCAYFDYIGCTKWETGCYKCALKREYPTSIIFDSSRWNFITKSNLFTSIEKLTIVTPSVWLSTLVKKSFLMNYPVRIINNGIDLGIFKPTNSNFRERYNLHSKFIVLAVAYNWDKRKGLDDVIELSRILDNRYKIIIVGLLKKQISRLPSCILGMERTVNINELTEIYSSADVLVNPTKEDNFPTVNMEAMACGTPVITYNTGGSVESIDNSCGIIVEKGNVCGLREAIEKLRVSDTINRTNCIEKAKLYTKVEKNFEYMDLYYNNK